jgi:hypothetical protein
MKLLLSYAYSVVLSCTYAMVGAAQDQPYTPVRGSVERNAIMDAFRPPIQQALGTTVIFTNVRLYVQNGWAFVEAAPRDPRGRRIIPAYRDDDPNCCSDLVIGLLRWDGRRWRTVEYHISPAEPKYRWHRHGAPSGIFCWNRREGCSG